jgi:rhamnose transport system permease protein
MKRRIIGVIGSWEALLVLMLAVVLAVGATHSPVFLTSRTVTAIMGDLSEKSVMVLTMTLIIIVGEIDLSVASTLGLASVTLGLLSAHHWPLPAAILAALVVGVACGAVNAFFVVRQKLPSLVVTLGTLALFRGLASVLIGDRAVSDFPDWFTNFGFANVPGTIIPMPFACFLVLTIVFWWLLSKSYWGRQLYATGLNQETARFSGISVARIKSILFMASGLFAAFAGVIYTAHYSSARSDNGLGYELDVITVTLLGGVSIFGGKGNLVGVLLALILVGTVRKALALADVPNEMHDVVIGALLIFAVLGPNLGRQWSEAWKQRQRAKKTLISEAASPS